MVAITVILAAVIGAFVLDIGQAPSEGAPQAQLGLAYEQTDSDVDSITLEHNGGDDVPLDDYDVIIANSEQGTAASYFASEGEVLQAGGEVTRNTEGDTFDEGQSIKIVWDEDGTVVLEDTIPGDAATST